jgi:hypothetical protein
MKQLLVLVVAVLFATTGVAKATSYSGTATATKMNGIPLSYSTSCTFIVDNNGYLNGDFTVGPHTIYLDSEEVITGPGTYPVNGYITLGNRNIPFSGTVKITSHSDTELIFTCNVKALNSGESAFSFSGTAN